MSYMNQSTDIDVDVIGFVKYRDPCMELYMAVEVWETPIALFMTNGWMDDLISMYA